MADPKRDPSNDDVFSEAEEEFFRAGDAIGDDTSADSSSDPADEPAPMGLWSRLFKRKPRADRGWPIGVARVRHSTGT